jgi:hypothetical protein
MTLRRQGPTRLYAPTSPHLIGNGMQRSCGRCGKHSSIAGSKRHPLFGMVGMCCTKGKA